MSRTIESVGVVGAGALGLMYAEKIKQSVADRCFFIADRKRVETIRKTKYIINGTPENFQGVAPEDMTEAKYKKPDLVIIAVKNHNLEDIGGLLDAGVENGTIIISVLNGIDSEGFLERRYPGAEVIRCVAVGMDAVKNGNNLNYTVSGRLLLGTKNNDKSNPSLLGLAAFLDSCGMAYELSDDIDRALWWKWMINIGVNQVSAVTGANYGVFHTDRTIQLLMESAMQETIDTAKAAGVDLRDGDIDNWYPILRSLGADNKTSMLQDIEAGRKTEVEAFSGRLMELGDSFGVDVPVNRTLFRIIRTRELLYN